MGLFKTVCMTLPVLLASTGSEAKEDEHPGVRRPESRLMQNQQGEHLQLSSPLRSVLHHPAFAGFARLLLPWDAAPMTTACRSTRWSACCRTTVTFTRQKPSRP